MFVRKMGILIIRLGCLFEVVGVIILKLLLGWYCCWWLWC